MSKLYINGKVVQNAIGWRLTAVPEFGWAILLSDGTQSFIPKTEIKSMYVEKGDEYHAHL